MRAFVFAIFIFSVTFSFGQELVFEKEKNSVKVTAKEETFSPAGKNQFYGPSDRDFLWSILGGVHRKYITNNQLEELKDDEYGFAVRLAMAPDGSIVSVEFRIATTLLEHISEDTIRQLHNAYRNTKIDVQKACFQPPLNENNYLRLMFRLK